jgi:hypothetical protein
MPAQGCPKTSVEKRSRSGTSTTNSTASTAPLMENRLRRGYPKASVMSWPPAPGLRRDSRNSGLPPPPLPPEVKLRYWHRVP